MKLFAKFFRDFFGWLRGQPEKEKVQRLEMYYGFTGKDLKAIKKAAEITGVSYSILHRCLLRMAIAVFASAYDDHPCRPVFEKMGIPHSLLRFSATRTPAEQFTLIAHQLQKIDNAAERVARTYAIFDRFGTYLLPLFGIYLEMRKAK